MYKKYHIITLSKNMVAVSQMYLGGRGGRFMYGFICSHDKKIMPMHPWKQAK